MGIAISGLISDSRVLCKYMRNECLNHKYFYKNADADEMIFIHKGKGKLRTMLGNIPFEYALINLVIDKSPPTAMRPFGFFKASSILGNGVS